MKLYILVITLCFAGVFAEDRQQLLQAAKVDYNKLTADATLTNDQVVALISKIRDFLAHNEEFQKFVTPEVTAAIELSLKQLEMRSNAGIITGGVILVLAEIIVDAYELALVYKKCEAMEDPTQQGFCFTRFAIKILTSINDIRLTIESIINRLEKSAVMAAAEDIQKPMPFVEEIQLL